MRQGIRRVCALAVAALAASAGTASGASAASLAIVSPAPATFVQGTDFIEARYSGLGQVTAPVTAVDLMEPGPTANTSTSGCEDTDFAGFPAGSIALVQRGTCLFQTKVENATEAGAAGVVIYNEGQPGRTAAVPTTLVMQQALPTVFSSYAVGRQIAQGVYNGGTGVVVELMTDGSSDSTPPVLDLPAEVVADATSPSGAAVTYSVSASDNLDPDPSVACTPASGGSFPIGSTTVTCTATDSAGNRSSGTFQVIVRSAAEQSEALVDDIESSDLPEGSKSSLTAKVEAAQASADRGNLLAACNMLDAFKREVSAQRGRRIPADEADALLAAADNIKAALGCP